MEICLLFVRNSEEVVKEGKKTRVIKTINTKYIKNRLMGRTIHWV